MPHDLKSHLLRRLYSRVFFAIGALVLIILVGSLGFYFIEGFTPLEAFYMTVITVSTVGYKEVHELSDSGRLFTIFLIITSFGTFAYALSFLTYYLLDGEYKRMYRTLKMTKRIESLKNHIIVCGNGRVGQEVVDELLFHNKEFVVVEKEDKAIEELQGKMDIPLYIKGDATEDENLRKAGIRNAFALITCLPNDADNLYVVLTARDMGDGILIISRASYNRSFKKLRSAGANNVIMPDSVGGSHMASLVMTPDLIQFLDSISIKGTAETNLEQIELGEQVGPDTAYPDLQSLYGAQNSGCNVIGLKTKTNDMLVNPPPNTELVPGGKLFVLGKPDQVADLRRYIG